jgi:hypothetical protein
MYKLEFCFMNIKSITWIMDASRDKNAPRDEKHAARKSPTFTWEECMGWSP